MFGENNIYKQFVDLKGVHPEVLNNPLIKRLENIVKDASPLKNFFNFERGDFSDPWETEDIIGGWEDLVDSPVEKISRFGKNLFMYSLITTGMNTRVNSFWNYVPPKFMKTIDVKGKTVSFDEGVKALRKHLDKPGSAIEYLDVIDDVFRHVPELKKDITSSNAKATVKGTYHKMITPFANPLFIGPNKAGIEIYTPYVTFRGKLYKYSGFFEEKKRTQPVYREINKKGYFEGGRNLTEYAYDVS